jgi:hypothetical protein
MLEIVMRVRKKWNKWSIAWILSECMSVCVNMYRNQLSRRLSKEISRHYLFRLVFAQISCYLHEALGHTSNMPNT